MVKCPHCGDYENTTDGGYFEMKFEQLQWTKGLYHDIMLYCPHCGVGIPEYKKTEMLAGGKWVAKNPGHWRAGFYISSLYSPLGWYSWADIAKEFEAAGNDPEKRQVFVNTTLGLPYENTGETIAHEYLTRRAEMYNAQVPDGVLQLTMAVDVQKTRLEYEVRGWGKGEESWGIEYGRIEGPTTELDSADADFPSVWKRLDELRVKGFTREDGYEMRISCVMIDSGGIDTTTDTVYKYTLTRERMRVFALKGSNQSKQPIFNRPHRRTANKCALFIAGTDKAKELIYSRLKIEERGPGFCHFPDNENTGYNAAYYASLTSERRMMKYQNGYKKLYWWKPKDARNEGLDLFVYNLVAIRFLNPNWDALAARFKKSFVNQNVPKPSKPTPRIAPPRIRRPEGISLSI
jgi:phage terminase large subunit GpA-like protein